MSFLLDTNLISELRTVNCDPRVRAWACATSDVGHYLSVLTLGEIRTGIEKLRRKGGHQKAANIESWLEELSAEYSDGILHITPEIADIWGRLSVPTKLSVEDSLIAATAIYHGLTVVTRNVKDFIQTGCKLLNPWEE